MVQSEKMQVETALFFETVEQIYERVFRALKPRTALPRISIRFRKYANATSRIRLEEGELRVSISDLLESAPAPIQEALAYILISKLYRKAPPASVIARYRRYLNRADVRRVLQLVQKERGRKAYRDPCGRVYDLRAIFEELNFEYFYGLMARPELGWSLRPSRTTLGHYDPSHHVIVVTNLFDSEKVPELLLKYVMFHEMLHLRYPTEHRGARRWVHTKEFKQAEKAFRGYKIALAEMRRFVNGVGQQAPD
jgi:predicted metal-dependent hydrolase